MSHIDRKVISQTGRFRKLYETFLPLAAYDIKWIQVNLHLIPAPWSDTAGLKVAKLMEWQPKIKISNKGLAVKEGFNTSEKQV